MDVFPQELELVVDVLFDQIAQYRVYQLHYLALAVLQPVIDDWRPFFCILSENFGA